MINTHEKPVIMIGIQNEDSKHSLYINEATFGIEEVGCLFSKYYIRNAKDIRYGICGITIIICNEEGYLYASEYSDVTPIYKTASKEPKAFRTLGKNAARYLKNMKLEF